MATLSARKSPVIVPWQRQKNLILIYLEAISIHCNSIYSLTEGNTFQN